MEKMIHVCTKRGCPKRFSIGSENDSDCLTYFCSECRKLYFYSESRTKRYYLFGKLFFFFILLLGFAYFANLFSAKNGIENVVLFQLDQDTIALGEYLAPTLLDSTVESYVLDMGNGKIFYDEFPDTYIYNEPGTYDIIFESNRKREVKSIIVTDSTVLHKNERGKGSPELISPVDSVGLSDIKVINTDSLPGEDIGDDNEDCVNIGKPCNDDDPSTEGDIYRSNCICAGIPIQVTLIPYYRDQDDDRLGDGSMMVKMGAEDDKDGYCLNSLDECPYRSGLKENGGCPQLNVILPDRIVRDEVFPASVEYGYKQNDNVLWSISGKRPNGTNGQKVFLKPEKYGQTIITVDVEGSDGYKSSATATICVQVSKKEFARQIKENIAPLGNYEANNFVLPEKIERGENAIDFLTSLEEPDIRIAQNGRVYGNDLGSFLRSKILPKESYVRDVKINKLNYNLQTCTISKLDISLIK